jgi:hypothetical protein
MRKNSCKHLCMHVDIYIYLYETIDRHVRSDIHTVVVDASSSDISGSEIKSSSDRNENRNDSIYCQEDACISTFKIVRIIETCWTMSVCVGKPRKRFEFRSKDLCIRKNEHA